MLDQDTYRYRTLNVKFAEDRRRLNGAWIKLLVDRLSAWRSDDTSTWSIHVSFMVHKIKDFYSPQYEVDVLESGSQSPIILPVMMIVMIRPNMGPRLTVKI
jgi:hypothetical protein